MLPEVRRMDISSPFQEKLERREFAETINFFHASFSALGQFNLDMVISLSRKLL
jgi:hypothetical protein